MEGGTGPTMAERKEVFKAEEKKMVDDARKAGAEAYTFDPKASPAEKAAQAMKVSELRCRSRKLIGVQVLRFTWVSLGIARGANGCF